MRNNILFVVVLAWVSLLLSTNAKFKFTNVVCTEVDKDFGKFQYCYIKSYNRTFNYFSHRYNIFRKPITIASVRWALLKRANGYKPFLYNITFDGCAFLKGRNSNPVSKYFYKLFRDYSNLNHSCPITEDIIVEKLASSHLDNELTITLPMPKGQYCFDTDWYAQGALRGNIRVFFNLT